MNMPNQEYNEIESPKYKNEINPVKGEANVSISNVLRGPMLRIALKKRESPRPIPTTPESCSMIQYEKGVGGNTYSRNGRSMRNMKIATTPVKKLKSIGGQDTRLRENM